MPTLFNQILERSQNKNLVPIFETKKPDSIRVGKVTENGISDIRDVPVKTLEETEHFIWSESNMIPEDVKKYIDSTLSKEVKSDEGLASYIGQFHPDLMIGDMGEKMGKGLFLAPDAKKKIRKGEFIGMYFGEYKSITKANTPEKERFLPYGLGTNDHPLFKDDKNDTCSEGQIDSQKIGNILRFAQDAPTTEELEDYSFKPGVQQQVATQNIRAFAGNYKGYPLVYFLAERDIEPGDEVVYSYKPEYWLGAYLYQNSKRLLTDKKGRLIPSDNYMDNFVIIHLVSKDKKETMYFRLLKPVLMDCLSKKQAFVTTDNGIQYQATLSELQQAFENQCTDKEKSAFKGLSSSNVDILAPLHLIELKQRNSKALANLVDQINNQAAVDTDNIHHVQFVLDIFTLIFNHKDLLELSIINNKDISILPIIDALNNLLKELKFSGFFPHFDTLKDTPNFYKDFKKEYGNNKYAETAYRQLQAFFNIYKTAQPLTELRSKIITCMKNYNQARDSRNIATASLHLSVPSSYKPKGPLYKGPSVTIAPTKDVAEPAQTPNSSPSRP